MFQLGVSEIVLLLLFVVPLLLFRGIVRRWFGVVAGTMILGVAVTPADPVSSLLVATVLSLTFGLGVCAAPHLCRVDVASK